MKRKFNLSDDDYKLIERSTLSKVIDFIDKTDVIKTPILLFDAEKMIRNAKLIGSGIERAQVYYAVKANDNIDILEKLSKIDLGFEIASDGELAKLEKLNVEGLRIITSNPVKTPLFIEKAYEYGVKYFAFDSEAEIDKLVKYAPKCSVYVRLIVPNEGSEWPLSKKFGVEVDDALSLLIKAKKAGLNPIGMTFHVGSQCTNINNWESALNKAGILWAKAVEAGINMRCLNIGGGYPIVYTKSVVHIENIEARINTLIKRLFPNDIDIYMEPGRAMVGDAGVFVTSIIGHAQRSGNAWCYIDVGVFNGLMESVGGIKYSYIAQGHERDGQFSSWTLTGPSCDSFDVIDKDVKLKEPQVGDLILILSAGAYTLPYASEFNGFKIPQVVFV
ncbi:MAG: type III PLP-dependent enzyme [Nitrospirae bacterium]|nr:type III PLP-dependent enzyme [Nitrospirota bacterium]MBF0541955.1 type III PLP-dependent enzyme [Nitrospirota bacterium]